MITWRPALITLSPGLRRSELLDCPTGPGQAGTYLPPAAPENKLYRYAFLLPRPGQLLIWRNSALPGRRELQPPALVSRPARPPRAAAAARS